MKKRLCDLVTLVTNDRDSVILAVKPDTQPMDLVRLGAGFYGDETLFRVSKHPDTVSVTIFRESKPPFTMHLGDGGTTVVPASMKAAREKILECVSLDFGIYVSKHYKGHSFNELVNATLGERTLDSERRYELRWGSSPYASLFVNRQQVALIEYDDVDRWMQERNVKRVQSRTQVWEYSGLETGVMERAERRLDREERKRMGRDDMSDMDEDFWEEPHDELADLKQEIMDFANERTNGAFAEYMTYEKAVQSLDEPGMGLPISIEDKVARIEELEAAKQDIEVQISEARATSEAMIGKNHIEKKTQGMEDPEL